MDIFDGTNIQAAGWLRSDQQFDRTREFARNDDLLLVAAGKRGYIDEYARRAHIELFYEVPGILIDRILLECNAMCKRRLVIRTQHHVVVNWER